jgi:tetratricopeptide (TPR) repeat protein
MTPGKKGKANRNAVLILAAITILSGAGLILGHRYRLRVIAQNALVEGQKYFDQQDWENASFHLKIYLSKCPGDIDVLFRYARAQMAIRPLKSENILSAIGTYRRLIRLIPNDPVPYKELADLYESIKNYSELAYIAQRRLRFAPDDIQAKVWLAKADIFLHKHKEARELLVSLVKQMPPSPERYAEFSQVCLFLSGLDAQADNAETRARADHWLDQAVERYPDRPEPYVNRACFYRRLATEDVQTRRSRLHAARIDLKRAEELDPDPQLRLRICHEWLDHGNLENAAVQLDLIEQMNSQTVNEAFTDRDDFLVAKFLLASELAVKNGTIKDGADLSDDILNQLTEKGRRLVVLPVAIKLYAATKQTPKARLCLDEYRDILRINRRIPESAENILLLEAIVAWAEGQPYRVIEHLEPAVGRNPNQPQMLALLVDAYAQTDQPWRAIHAMKQYLTFAPDDDAMACRLVQIYLNARKWKEALNLATRLQTRLPDYDALALEAMQAEVQLLSDQPSNPNSAQIEKIVTNLDRFREKNPQNVFIRILQARLALKRDKPDQARTILDEAVRECTDSIDAEMELVRLDQKIGKISQAIDRCRKLCQSHETVTSLWLLLSECQAESHQYEQAQSTLEKAGTIVTDAADRRLLARRLAILKISHGDRQKGIDQLKAMADEDKQDFQTRELLLDLPEICRDRPYARRLIDDMRQVEGENGFRWRIGRIALWLASPDWRKHRDQISVDLNRCVKTVPDWSVPLLLLGRFHEKLGDLAAAETLYRQTLAQAPEMVDVADRLIALLEGQKRLTEARELVNQLEIAPAGRYHRLALIAIKVGNYSQAIDDLNHEIDHNPLAVDAYLRLARLIYRQNEDSVSALEILDRAEVVAPNRLPILAARCDILRSEGRMEQAIDLLNQTVEKSGTFETVLLRAAFLDAVGRKDEAENDYSRLTILNRQGLGFELMGNFYTDHQRFDDALTVLEKGVQKYPENISLKHQWMKGLLLRGRPDDQNHVVDILNQLEKIHPDNPHLLQVRVMILLRENTPQADRQAEDILRRVIEIDPAAVNAHLKLIALMMKRGDYAGARDLAIQAQADNPENLQLLLARAQAEQMIGNSAVVVELARFILRDDPKNNEALTILVKAAVNSNDNQVLAETGDLVEQALARDPHNDQVYLAQAQILRSLGRIGEAIERLETYGKSNGKKQNLSLLLTLAELYRLDGNFESADVRLRLAEKLAPHAPAVLRQRLFGLAGQKKYESIVQRMTVYLSSPDCDPGIVTLAASILDESGDSAWRKQAIDLLDKLVRRYPDLADAQLQLAWLAFQEKDYDRAERLYRKLLAAYPSDPNALNNLAWILAHVRRDYSEALALVNRGVELVPDKPDLRDTRAEILIALDRLREARADYEKCVSLLPPDSPAVAETFRKLGELCVRLNDKLQAGHYFRQALDLDRKVGGFSPDQRKNIEAILNQLPDSKARTFP